MHQHNPGAYDLPERVASYDADMDVMHPNRAKMTDIALEVLPLSGGAVVRALDLGVGTGYFAGRFLTRFSAGRVVAVDAAQSMLDLARVRLSAVADRVDLRLGDFRRLADIAADAAPFDVIFSSYALHHLNSAEKQDVVRQSLAHLRPGGWFVNADLIVAEVPRIERRIQELRVEGIVARAAGSDPRFADFQAARAFLDEVESRDADQPVTLREDLRTLASAGVQGATAFWLEYREAVCGGYKQGPRA